MIIREGFVVRQIAGQSFVVALGSASKAFNGMIKLNETARLIWDMIADGNEKERIVEKILEEYDVDRAMAESDYDALIGVLQEAGVFEAE